MRYREVLGSGGHIMHNLYVLCGGDIHSQRRDDDIRQCLRRLRGREVFHRGCNLLRGLFVGLFYGIYEAGILFDLFILCVGNVSDGRLHHNSQQIVCRLRSRVVLYRRSSRLPFVCRWNVQLCRSSRLPDVYDLYCWAISDRSMHFDE